MYKNYIQSNSEPSMIPGTYEIQKTECVKMGDFLMSKIIYIEHQNNLNEIIKETHGIRKKNE